MYIRLFPFVLAFALTIIQTTEVTAQSSSTSGIKLGELKNEDGYLVQHRSYWIHKSGEVAANTAKSSTLNGDFDVNLPNGPPRSGVPGFVMEYEIVFVSDDENEGIDYFAYAAPSGWTITAIGPPPSQTACADNPHTAVISGFSSTSAYWGGDYGGGVVTPGNPATYPAIGNRSFNQGGCGAFATEITPAAADTHTFSITLTPLAVGQCPGTTTGALPLCCAGSEISAGSPPPAGSESYFQEMTAGTDGNAEVFGDVFYYYAQSCPNPFIDLQKWPQPAGSGEANCVTTYQGNPFPDDTLWVSQPPGGQGEFCFSVSNISNIIWGSTQWGYTQCDSVNIQDDSLGIVLDQSGLAINPDQAYIMLDDSLVSAPDAGECWDNEAVATCTTPPGSDYVLNVGVVADETNTSVPNTIIPGLAIDDASICALVNLPVELASMDASVDGNRISLNWITATETNNAGFEIQHRPPGKVDFQSAGFVEGAGTSISEQHYAFTLESVEPGRHSLRLKQLDFDGTFEISGTVEVSVEVPGTHVLSPIYPNPFNPQARLSLVVSRDQHVRVDVFDATGRSVSRVFEGEVTADHRVLFELRSDELASGTYLVRVVGDYFTDTRQVTLAK